MNFIRCSISFTNNRVTYWSNKCQSRWKMSLVYTLSFTSSRHTS